MKRRYYISDSLQDLESLEASLVSAGFDRNSIHYLSDNDAELEKHHLHAVDSLSKKDIFNSGFIGFVIGLVGGALILSVSYVLGLHTFATWAPVLFVSFGFLGFCTWEGGLWGIQQPNRYLKRFQAALKDGKYIVFVDLDPSRESEFKKIVATYDSIKKAGKSSMIPMWEAGAQHISRLVRPSA